MTSDSSRLVGLELRISEYKPITNKALVILRSDESLQLNDDLSVLASENRQSENAAPRCCVVRVNSPWYSEMKVS